MPPWPTPTWLSPTSLTAADARTGRWAQLAGGARILLGLALGVALPPLCAACRTPVGGEGLCAACWSKLSFIAPPYCARLGIPFALDPGPGTLSMEAIADPPTYNRARAAVRTTTPPAPWCKRSNTATVSILRLPWGVGWHRRGMNC